MPRLIRRIAMILACVMVVEVSIPMPSVYAREVVNIKAQNTQAKGDLTTTIRFDYPSAYNQVKKQDITVTLKKDGKNVVTIKPGADQQVVENEGSYSVKVTAKNTHNVERTTEDIIGAYDITIEDLEIGTYQFVYEGKGYKTYTSNDIVIDQYSKNITVGTGDGTFSYGDIDGKDGVTQDDLKALENNIKENNHEYDLNGDGKVDIAELTYVQQQIGVIGEDLQTDGAAIIKEEIIAAADEAIEKAGLTITNGSSVADLFTKGNEVRLEKSPNAEKLEIPIPLGTEGIETQVIEFNSSAGQGGLESGTVFVEYEENGETKIEPYSFESTVEMYKDMRVFTRSDNRNTITINLGKKVPVKRITISVDKVLGEDGSPNYVVMEEVTFVKDIASNVSPVDKSVIKNITVTEKDGEVALEWDLVPNVEGYTVFYGEKSGDYKNQKNVDQPSANIEGLENLKTYYFMIRATSGEWMGTPSEEKKATPQPSKAPLPPDNLKVTAMNGGLTLNWDKTEDATYYKVFYKEADAPDTDYEQFKPSGNEEGKITATSIVVGGLTNEITYNVYVVAGNSIGESGRSLVKEGKPEKLDVNGPVLPSQNRIQVTEIEKIELKDTRNVADIYPNGFNLTYDLKDTKDGIKNVVDGDYATHWTAGDWQKTGQINFTFKTPHEMNYVVYVPRLDGGFANVVKRYHITIWGENDDLSGPGTEIVTDHWYKQRTDKDGKKYAIFEFPKTKVKKIGIWGRIQDGAWYNTSASEIAFYNYDSLEDDIEALFEDDAFTTLKPEVTQEDITAIKEKLESKDAYYVDSEIFMDEINLAQALFEKDKSKLGMVKEGLLSIDGSGDVKGINDWSPLGIVGFAGKQMTIYADIPDGETVQIIPTQYYAEAGALTGDTIELTKGRNVIDISKIGNITETAGGAFYYKYSGENGDQIKLHIRSVNNGFVQIPTLELYDWYKLSEEERKARISQYIDDLVAYAPNKLQDLETNPANATEISGRNVLLSLPADQVLAGITSATADKEAQIKKLYNNMLAWEEVIEVVHTTYGLEDPSHVLKTRQNIRYMRMFGKAFMYAAGSHIGVGYGSTSALVQGKPTSLTTGEAENGLFGWGIGHEIGHNMDRLRKAEITNNIYSILLQTYDGKDNILKSRLELSNKYEEIYKKVAVGDKGMANDVFTQLGMYWQLHLAYDNGEKDETNGPLSFYHKLFKVYDSGAVNGFEGDDQFAVAASMVAGKDLTEFFTKWGMDLSNEAKVAMKDGRDKEERKIQYLTDEARRYRLSNGQGIKDMELTATTTVVKSSTDEANANAVKVTIHPDETIDSKHLLGYEIFRDDKQIAFITGTTYEDLIGSANNKAFDYEVRAIDTLGNVINKDKNQGKVDAGQVRIEHDNVIDKDQYSISFVEEDPNTTTGAALVLTFDKKTTPVTGIRVKSKDGSSLPTGTFTIQVGRKNEDEVIYSTAKKGDFQYNDVKDESKFINYFNKPGTTSDDTRIWTYDADVIRITGEKIGSDFLEHFDVEPLSYPGDNVAFEEYKVGIMKEDYHYEDVEGISTIKAGTLVVLGSYRGDPLYNTIQIVGQYAERVGEDEEIKYVPRPVSGELLMFAEVPEDGETSDISDGFFLFIPEVQEETKFEHGSGQISALPTQIMAKMQRYDNTDHTGTPRVTSTTMWYSTPSYDSMPYIQFTEDNSSFLREAMYEAK